MISRVLNGAAISTGVCATIQELRGKAKADVGAVIIADEALRSDTVEQFGQVLQSQDSWSDLPVIVLTVGGESSAATRYRLHLLSPLGNITLLERPLRAETAISAVQAALRTRRYQYRIRDLLEAEQRASEALRESEQHLRYTVELNPQVPWTADPDGKLETFSDRWLSLTGLRRDEAMNGGWSLVTHPEDQAAASSAWQHSIKTGEPYDVAQRIKLADGSFRWMRSRANPRREADGRIVRWYGTTEDIDQEKLSEEMLRESNAELRAVNRELEEFAYVASHDLQEPLRMINIYTQMLMRKLSPHLDDSTQQYADFIKNGVIRMEALLHDLLSFSRLIHSDRQSAGEADLTNALKQAITTLGPTLEELGADISFACLPAVRGDEGQLAQVFQNLLSNALKYRKPFEQPRIEVEAKPHPTGWKICVKDNGIGFDQRHGNQIFGLFKRLFKDEYPGTGIGLAICKRIVERYGGQIWAESVPDKGSTFFFTLERVDANE